jgi:triacylglycerol lipase
MICSVARATSFPLRAIAAVCILLGSVGHLNADDAVAKDQPKSEAIRIIKDQRYSTDAGKFGFCDVYQPGQPAPSDGYPVVLVIHGGGWLGGDKWELGLYGRSLAEAGMVAICINYRLAPADKFPAQIDDVRQALLWTRQQSQKRSLDIERLGVFGYSAGGHLALLAASIADESMEDQVIASNWPSEDSRWTQIPSIRAVCAGGPPCDFQSLPADNTALAYFLGGSKRQHPDLYRVASPLAHVSPADPPSKIVHGDVDFIVPVKGSKDFYEQQQKTNLDASLDVLTGHGHMLTFMNPRTRRLMVDFFREKLDSGKPH